MARVVRRKRYFFLIEVGIALAIVALAFLPFIQMPWKQTKKEIDALFSMMLVEHIDNELAQLYEEASKLLSPNDLLNRDHREERVVFSEQKTKVLTLPNSSIHTSYLLERKITVYGKKNRKIAHIQVAMHREGSTQKSDPVSTSDREGSLYICVGMDTNKAVPKTHTE